ncbi:hypothetical protein S7711_00647 [Stachybotrys chartarum IBT 7711]|uniref:Uncharacterized protein n=1 Tax=Stachybotrys chartarum (strain CBS 109288 / IBT 7711) TaxID=1280523 RepID=A0A084ATZ9_STACB|nr:hypothetical protein S7711_00647 [Stachybotrys chartarum IBT 7711]
MPRRPTHKLSKPRTGNPSAAPSPVTSPQSATSPRFSSVSLIGSPTRPLSYQQSPAAAAPWPLAPGDGMKDRLETLPEGLLDTDNEYTSKVYRTRTLQSEQASRRNSLGVGTTGLGDPRGSFHALPRTGEVSRLDRTMSLQNFDFRAPPKHDLHPYEAQRLSMNRDECDIITSPVQESFEAASSIVDLQQSTSASITRRNSEVSLCTPMRRRSMIQTPGVATRAQVPLSTKSSFRRSHPPTPNMSRRNSIEPMTARHTISLPPPPVPSFSQERSITPSEEEFKQLGAMKFGSLRIVNGSPIPTPTPEPGHRCQGPSTALQRDASQSYFEGVKTGAVDEGFASKVKGNLVQERTTTERSALSAAETAQTETRQSENWASQPTSSSFEKFIALSSNQNGYPYLADLQVTSKHTEHEDELFEEDGSPSEFIVPEVLDIREDSSAKPLLGLDSSAHIKASDLTRSDSGYVASPSSEVSRLPLTKSDSGYASKASIRSLHGSKSKTRDEDMDALPLGDASNDDKTTSRRSTKDKRLEYLPLSSNPPMERAPVMSPKNLLSPSLLRLSSARSRGSHDSQEMSTGSGHASTNSVEPEVNQTDFEPVGVAKRPSRLQRLLSVGRRKSLPAAHTVFANHEIDSPVPAIPVDMENHLDERNGQFPAATRRLALRLEPSMETLRTIFSVGSMDVGASEDQGGASRRESSHELAESHRRSLHRISLRSLRKTQSHMTIPDIALSQPSAEHPGKLNSDLANRSFLSPTNPSNKDEQPKADDVTIAPQESGATGANDFSPRSRRTLTKPNRDGRVGRSLTTHDSEPDFLKVDPMAHGRYSGATTSAKRSKTPPPLSMRSHNARRSALAMNGNEVRMADYSYLDKKGGPQGPAQDRALGLSKAEWTTSVSNRETIRSLRRRSEPLQGRPLGESLQQTPQARNRSSRDGHDLNQYPLTSAAQRQMQSQLTGSASTNSPNPQSHNRILTNRPYQRHARGGSLDSRSSGEQNPPYRVLHSYNSPAYRGLPIWG